MVQSRSVMVDSDVISQEMRWVEVGLLEYRCYVDEAAVAAADQSFSMSPCSETT